MPTTIEGWKAVAREMFGGSHANLVHKSSRVVISNYRQWVVCKSCGTNWVNFDKPDSCVCPRCGL